jgi:hypothetical protein
MLVGTFPEDNYADSPIFEVREGESDEDAIARAVVLYGDGCEFYIE